MIFLKQFETPIGIITAGADDKGICLLEFENSKRTEDEKRKISEYLRDEFIEGDNRITVELVKEINEYFNGTRKIFTIPLVLTGTQFQNRIWNELLKIPYGTTRTYMEQAETYGNPASIRAIAGANSENRISIIIPCHRVVGKNGDLTGYGGGLWRKRWLIEHEKRYSGQPVSQSLF
jgi:AraC family transcriptional regulator of adaptative response/methylated-DNA-[protein]-cysteine methyltransferase